MTNVIDYSWYFTEITKHNQEERMIAEMISEDLQTTEYQNGLSGYRIFTVDENYNDVEYDDYILDDLDNLIIDADIKSNPD